MKYLLALTVIAAFNNQALAAEDPLTVAFLSIEKNKNVFIQASEASTDGKKVCHGPLSVKRSEQQITVNLLTHERDKTGWMLMFSSIY